MKAFGEMTPEELLEAAILLQQEKETAISEKESAILEKTEVEKNAQAEITKLKSKVKEAKDSAAPSIVIVEHEGEKYKVTQNSFRLPYSISKGQNTSLKAEELKTLPKTIALLVEIGSGVLQKVG